MSNQILFVIVYCTPDQRPKWWQENKLTNKSHMLVQYIIYRLLLMINSIQEKITNGMTL